MAQAAPLPVGLLTHDAAAGRSLVSCAAGVLHSLVLCVCPARSSSPPLLEHISFPHPAGSDEGQEQRLQRQGARQGLTALTPEGCVLCPLASAVRQHSLSCSSSACPAISITIRMAKPHFDLPWPITLGEALCENYQVGSPCSRSPCLRGEGSVWDYSKVKRQDYHPLLPPPSPDLPVPCCGPGLLSLTTRPNF